MCFKVSLLSSELKHIQFSCIAISADNGMNMRNKQIKQQRRWCMGLQYESKEFDFIKSTVHVSSGNQIQEKLQARTSAKNMHYILLLQ